ncbi:DNA polymerase III subunit delta [Mycoplasmopsis bovirhinis]|uniref:DNA polymerase III subunit delta n=1 Tax=Mycoplasmopsis bovirhinis TaxID=29553 RepID=UPI000BB9EE91|nr:DNA polymerase III subunit delta [Mycoplasmopsis bovirhinis]BBA22197.1 DNA polymerase III subunit delta [Mycoplasmopsis bovirhinis]
MENIYSKIAKLSHNNKLAHLYLFDTKRIFNVKKEILSLIYTLNGLSLPEIISTKLDLNNLFSNVYYLDGSGEKIKKETLENFFSKVNLDSLEQKYKHKLAVIEDLQNTQKESLNTILKEIEEPSENVVIFIFSKNYKQLLPTILSRAQLLKLQEIKENSDQSNSSFSIIAKLFANYDKVLFEEYQNATYQDLFDKYLKILKNTLKKQLKFSYLYLELNNDLNKENKAQNKFILNILKSIVVGINITTVKNKYISAINDLSKEFWNTYPNIGSWVKDVNSFFESLKTNANFKIQKQVLLIKLGEIYG